MELKFYKCTNKDGLYALVLEKQRDEISYDEVSYKCFNSLGGLKSILDRPTISRTGFEESVRFYRRYSPIPLCGCGEWPCLDPNDYLCPDCAKELDNSLSTVA
jgi:hypothetical protein